MRAILLFLLAALCAYQSTAQQNRYWISTTASNWNNSANWSTTATGPGGSSVPGSLDVAIFTGSRNGNCTLDIAPTVSGITMNAAYAGAVNLNGRNLTTATGNNIFNSGTVNNSGASASLVLNGSASTTFSGAVISVPVTGTTADLYLNGSTFGSPVDITKTGSTGNGGAGGNTFNSTLILTNNGDGDLNTGNTNPDIFNAAVTINNTGTARFQIGINSAGNVFNAGLTINHGGSTVNTNTTVARNTSASVTIKGSLVLNSTNTSAASGIVLANDGHVDIMGNVTVTSSSGRGVFIGGDNTGAAGSVTLASGVTVTSPAGSFTTGTLAFMRTTQTGTATPQVITLSGTAYISVGPASTFNSTVNFTAPQLNLNSSTFNNTATFEKTGATDNASPGGNTFNGTTTINNSGSGEIFMGNGTADTFNGATTFNNTGSFRIRIAHNHPNQTTTFASDVTLNANKTGGTDPWSFLIGEVSNSNVSFAGNVTFNIGGTLQSDCRFLNGAAAIGTIGGTLTLNVTNTHPSTTLNMGANGAATYNGNIVVSNTGGANGILFTAGTSLTSTLAAGRTISLGGAGFNAGILNFARFTQAGATPQTLTTFTGTAVLILGTGSTFNGNIDFRAPQIYLNGTTCNGAANIEKNGAGDNYAAGGNTFNGVTTITNSGPNYLLTGATNADAFNGVTTFNNIGINRIYIAHNHANQTTTFANDVTFNSNRNSGTDQYAYLISENANANVAFNGRVTFNCDGTVESDYRILNGTGTTATFGGVVTVNVSNTHPSTTIAMGLNGTSTYNNNIVVTNTGGASGIYFNTGASASATLAATRTITIGVAGFTGGNLSLVRFTQTGATPQVLNTFSGTARLVVGPTSSFDGNVTFKAPQIMLNGGTYNGTATIEKTGASDNYGVGGNTFQGVTDITNSGSGYLLVGGNTADTFNGVTTFNNTGSYRIYVAQNHANQTTIFNADVTFNSNKSGGTDTWSYFIGEGASTFVQFNSNVTFNIGGTLQSDHRILNGTGSTLTAYGTTTVNITNTNPSTVPYLGVNGASTYNGNIVLSNSSGVNTVYFNFGGSATATLANGRTITIGPGGFTGGTLYLQRFTQVGGTAQTLSNFTGTSRLVVGPASSFDGNVTFSAPQMFLNSAIYNGAATLEKTGATDNGSAGGNTFNGITTITNSGSGNFSLGNGTADSFAGIATFNNNGSHRILIAHNHPGQTTTFATHVVLNSNRTGANDQWSYLIAENNNSLISFGGDVTINCNGAQRSDYRFVNGTGATMTYTGKVTINLNNTHSNTAIYMGVNGTSTYNNDIIVTNTTGVNGIYFNYNAIASSTLANGRTISIGPGGFTGGLLSLVRFIQIGPTPQTLNTFTGTSRLNLGPGSSFDGSVDFRAPQIYFQSAVYNGVTYLEKTGATDNYSDGGNTFNGVTTIANNGSGEIFMGNVNADVFNANTIFNNTGAYRIRMAYNHTNQTTTFASDLTLNSNKTGGTDAWSFLVCDGANTNMSVVGRTTLNIAGTLRSDHRFVNGAGSTITFGGGVTVNLTNTHAATVVSMGVNGTTSYNGDIIVSNTGGANGIFFNTNVTASSTLANGRTISIAPAGFTSGTLSLLRFTQVGTTPQTMTTFSGTSMLILGLANTFNGNVTFTAPQVLLNGTTYNGAATIEKSGATDNASVGGNTFNGVTTITNSGSGYLLAGNTTADAFNGPTTMNNTGVHRIYIAHNHTGQTTTFTDLTLNNTRTAGTEVYSYQFCEGGNTNLSISGTLTINCAGTVRSDVRFLQGAGSTGAFGAVAVNLSNTNASTVVTMGANGTSTYSGNIVVANTGGASGIYFNTGATASSVLAASRTIGLGAAGFSAGTLSLIRFTQTGGTTQTLNTFSGTATLVSGPSSAFGGNVTFVAPQLYLNGAVYSGTVYAEKTGAGNNDHTGGNTYHGATTIVNSSAARMRLANTNADTYNANASFVKSSSGAFEPAYNLTNTFAGNIATNSNAVLTFGQGTGVVEFIGGTAQQVSKTASTSSPIFQRMRINKTAGSTVTLATDVTVGSAGTFTSGTVNTSAVNILNFANGATVTGASDISYVDGPVRKTGTNTFVFPTGAAGYYRSIALATAPTNAADQFTAQYFKAGQTYGDKTKWDPTFYTVSGCEYWILDRTTGTSNVNVTLSWNSAICTGSYITNPATLRVARWNGTSWVTHGNGGTTGNSAAGTITTAAAVTSFSPFTLATTTGANPLPVTLEHFWAVNNESTVTLNWTTASEQNSDKFTLQRSPNGFDFETIYTVKAAGNSMERMQYTHTDDGPFGGLSYYRLIQTDYDGQSQSWIAAVRREGEDLPFTVSPNPAGGEVVKFNQTASIVVMNSLGQVVATTTEATSLNATVLAPGVYTIRNQKGQVVRLVRK